MKKNSIDMSQVSLSPSTSTPILVNGSLVAASTRYDRTLIIGSEPLGRSYLDYTVLTKHLWNEAARVRFSGNDYET
jgi:hypothetical protein